MYKFCKAVMEEVHVVRGSSRKLVPISSRDGITSQMGMCMCSSREEVFGNNVVQFQSCDGSSYCTALGENGFIDIVSCQLWDSSGYQISACSEAISSRDPPPIVPRVWARQYGQFTGGRINVHNEDCSGWLSLVLPELKCVAASFAEPELHNLGTLWSIPPEIW